MKSTIQFLAFGIVFLLCCSAITSCNNHNEKKPPTSDELSQMNKDFAKAINNKDATAAANLYTDDAMELPPGEAHFSGKENIKKYWEAAIKAGAFDVSVSTISTGNDGDLGYETGRFKMSTKDSTGKVTVESGKYLELLKRGEDGKWRSTHGIWNTDTLGLK